MSERWAHHSSQWHGSGSGRPDLVSNYHSRAAEALRDQLARPVIGVENVVRALAAWHSVLPGSRHFLLD